MAPAMCIAQRALSAWGLYHSACCCTAPSLLPVCTCAGSAASPKPGPGTCFRPAPAVCNYADAQFPSWWPCWQPTTEMRAALLAQEMKDLLAKQLEAGGREEGSPAGRRLRELVRHVRIMRPCRLVRLRKQRHLVATRWPNQAPLCVLGVGTPHYPCTDDAHRIVGAMSGDDPRGVRQLVSVAEACDASCRHGRGTGARRRQTSPRCGSGRPGAASHTRFPVCTTGV